MQATLVSHYSDKPDKLITYLEQCQRNLSDSLAAAFTPYEMPQIHGTIIGLEGCRRNSRIENTNFRVHRREVRYMDPVSILKFLRSAAVPEFDVQIGGYHASNKYGFLSQEQHPYLRSFSIKGDIALAMGWPTGRVAILDEFRRLFMRHNVLHKWHQTEPSIDNDFYFVLGHINRNSVNNEMIVETETHMRKTLSSSRPINIRVNTASLRIVCYTDVQLPIATSHAHAIDEATFTPGVFLRCYDECTNNNE